MTHRYHDDSCRLYCLPARFRTFGAGLIVEVRDESVKYEISRLARLSGIETGQETGADLGADILSSRTILQNALGSLY